MMAFLVPLGVLNIFGTFGINGPRSQDDPVIMFNRLEPQVASLKSLKPNWMEQAVLLV